jgi:hypothetical protein
MTISRSQLSNQIGKPGRKRRKYKTIIKNVKKRNNTFKKRRNNKG